MNGPVIYTAAGRKGRRRKRFLLPVIYALLGVAAVFLVVFLVSVLRPLGSTAATSVPETPVGAWETTTGQGSESARLEFMFRPNGSGLFRWQMTGGGAETGKAPLHWSLDEKAQMALEISSRPDASYGRYSDVLIGILNGSHWHWHADSAQKRLILGNLILTEKRK